MFLVSCAPTFEDAGSCVENYFEDLEPVLNETVDARDFCTPSLNLLRCAKYAARQDCNTKLYDAFDDVYDTLCTDFLQSKYFKFIGKHITRVLVKSSSSTYPPLRVSKFQDKKGGCS